ncbi:MAG: NADH-quinone oxidoreductase subunit C [Phycisphaerae bacterium]
MTVLEIVDILKHRFGADLVGSVVEGTHPHVVVRAEKLVSVCEFLRDDEKLRFDLLRCVSGVDWMGKNLIEVSYDLISIRFGHALAVKVILDRAKPQVETVSGIWQAANWHEREAFDLVGVQFVGHTDLVRILMPEDWVGHPLRKDYQDPVEYHGLKVKP